MPSIQTDKFDIFFALVFPKMLKTVLGQYSVFGLKNLKICKKFQILIYTIECTYFGIQNNRTISTNTHFYKHHDAYRFHPDFFRFSISIIFFRDAYFIPKVMVNYITKVSITTLKLFSHKHNYFRLTCAVFNNLSERKFPKLLSIIMHINKHHVD